MMLLFPTPPIVPLATWSRPFGMRERPHVGVDTVTTAMLSAGAVLVSMLHSALASSVSTMNALNFLLAMAFSIMFSCVVGFQSALYVVTVAPGILATAAMTSLSRMGR